MIVSIDMLFPTKISGTFFVVCLEAIGFPVAQKAKKHRSRPLEKTAMVKTKNPWKNYVEIS